MVYGFCACCVQVELVVRQATPIDWQLLGLGIRIGCVILMLVWVRVRRRCCHVAVGVGVLCTCIA